MVVSFHIQALQTSQTVTQLTCTDMILKRSWEEVYAHFVSSEKSWFFLRRHNLIWLIFGMINPFSWIFNAVSGEKSCPTSVPFL